MKEILSYIGAGIILFCTVPYLIDIVRRKTKPNVVTWLVWSVLLAIAAFALLAEGQTSAALLVIGDTLSTFAVVLFGLKYGIAKLDRFDLGCLAGAVIGLILWMIFNSPMIAIIATITIDLIGTVPTIRHSWWHPDEETSITFALGVVATVFTLFSLSEYSLAAWIYPVYLLLSNGVLYITVQHGQNLKTA